MQNKSASQQTAELWNLRLMVLREKKLKFYILTVGRFSISSNSLNKKKKKNKSVWVSA